MSEGDKGSNLGSFRKRGTPGAGGRGMWVYLGGLSGVPRPHPVSRLLVRNSRGH